jgi:hypothetical protein
LVIPPENEPMKTNAMLTFPVQNAAASLNGKPPEELPHGLLAPPAEVRAIVERERQKHPPEAFARAEVEVLNLETIGWYFDGLCHEMIYRETPEGPEVLAVAVEEAAAFRRTTPPEAQRQLKGYLGY